MEIEPKWRSDIRRESINNPILIYLNDNIVNAESYNRQWGHKIPINEPLAYEQLHLCEI